MPTTVDGLDPAEAHTWVEYSRCLQDLYARSGRPSFRKVASRSRRAGQAISPSTAQNLVAGAGRPQRRSVEGFLAGCRLPKTERVAWLDVWDRLNARRGSEVSLPRATVPASIEDPAVRSRARLFYIGTVILLIGLIILAYLLGLEAADKLASVLSALLAVYTIAESRRTRRKDAASPNSAEQEERSRAAPMRPTKAVVTATVTATVAFSCGNNVASAPDDRYSPYECSTPVGAAGSIAPRPTFAEGLVFCPLEVNDGIVDITGPFLVTGQILGTRPRGTELVLFVRIDPATCDTEGRPGAPGRFLLQQVNLSAASEGWSYGDHFGDYPEGITFGRIYEFALLSPALMQSITKNAEHWKQSGIADDDLQPPEFQPLSRFDVPPGRSDDAAACD